MTKTITTVKGALNKNRPKYYLLFGRKISFLIEELNHLNHFSHLHLSYLASCKESFSELDF